MPCTRPRPARSRRCPSSVSRSRRVPRWRSWSPAMTEGAHSGPKQARSRATRRRLLETTIRCVATYGFPTSTVGFIAAEAGISRGAVQHHFRTREDLILAALEHMFAERVALLDAMPERDGPDRVHAVVSDLVEATIGGELFRAALQV